MQRDRLLGLVPQLAHNGQGYSAQLGLATRRQLGQAAAWPVQPGVAVLLGRPEPLQRRKQPMDGALAAADLGSQLLQASSLSMRGQPEEQLDGTFDRTNASLHPRFPHPSQSRCGGEGDVVVRFT